MMKIRVNGETMGADVTMGAMLLLHEMTGKEVTDIKGVTDLLKYCYCCAKAIAQREGRKFDYTLQDFANRVAPKDFNGWCAELTAQGGEEAPADEGKK